MYCVLIVYALDDLKTLNINIGSPELWYYKWQLLVKNVSKRNKAVNTKYNYVH